MQIKLPEMKVNIFIACIISLVLIACSYGDVFKTYQYMDKWEIKYPPYMKKSSYVYPGAEFQAMNNYRDTYMFARELVSSASGDFLLDSLSKAFQPSLVNPKIIRDSSYIINGNQFYTQYITGLWQDKRMFYILSVIEKNNIKYHFSGWMFDHKRELWEEDYEKALHSWKTLK